jgi:beta-phosphoglucomutase-like phosphatase (HAD superfamily)
VTNPRLTFDATRYDAAIFDCDGTLVDAMPIHHAAWRALAGRAASEQPVPTARKPTTLAFDIP